MRSRKHSTVSATEVHQWALQRLLDARLLKKDHGPRCTATVVWNVVLRTAARLISIFAACRDLSDAPSQQAVFDALEDGLPRTLPVQALIDGLPRRMRRPTWQVAIDWHLVPYYGEPQHSRNEIYYGKPKQGTSHFHAYATACIVQYGERYTLALTWVRRHESTVVVLRRLLARIREIGLKIKGLLLDRAFFSCPVAAFLQGEGVPFLMPVMFRGRKPKKRRTPTGLQWIKRQKAGWYPHTLKSGTQSAVRADLRGVPDAPPSQDQETPDAKAAVRGVAHARRTDGDSRTLPQAFRHRVELPAAAASADSHLHTQPALAAGLRGGRVDPAQPVGVDPRNDPGGRPRRDENAPAGSLALQAPARLDRPGRCRCTS